VGRFSWTTAGWQRRARRGAAPGPSWRPRNQPFPYSRTLRRHTLVKQFPCRKIASAQARLASRGRVSAGEWPDVVLRRGLLTICTSNCPFKSSSRVSTRSAAAPCGSVQRRILRFRAIRMLDPLVPSTPSRLGPVRSCTSIHGGRERRESQRGAYGGVFLSFGFRPARPTQRRQSELRATRDHCQLRGCEWSLDD